MADGVVYSQALPEGSIRLGIYSIAETAEGAVSLNASVTLGSPIQLLSNFTPGSVVSSSQPQTVKWAGGEAGALVKVSLSSGSGPETRSAYTYADALAGSLTIAPICTGKAIVEGGTGLDCGFGIPTSANAQLNIEVAPAPERVTAAAALGLTAPVQLTWRDSHTFLGLELK